MCMHLRNPPYPSVRAHYMDGIPFIISTRSFQPQRLRVSLLHGRPHSPLRVFEVQASSTLVGTMCYASKAIKIVSTKSEPLGMSLKAEKGL